MDNQHEIYGELMKWMALKTFYVGALSDAKEYFDKAEHALDVLVASGEMNAIEASETLKRSLLIVIMALNEIQTASKSDDEES